MFREFHSPSCVDGTIWPPRSTGEVMLDYMFRGIGHEGMRNGIMTALDALNEF
jgi:hypothetical protein